VIALVKFSYYGHAAFLLDDGTHKVLVDPFLTGNPVASVKADDVECDYILVSHAHGDHLGDAPSIAARTGAKIVSTPEVISVCESQTLAEIASCPMNIGGSLNLPFGKVRMTFAQHSAGVAGGVAGSAAFGADGVIIPQRRSADVNATVWKGRAGAAARVPVAKETNLVRTLEAFKARGCFVVGLDGNASVSVDNLNLADQPLVLVTGAEGKGLSRLVRETCDEIASINIRAAVESLNAAVATGIALYEVDRGRRAPARAGQRRRLPGARGLLEPHLRRD